MSPTTVLDLAPMPSQCESVTRISMIILLKTVVSERAKPVRLWIDSHHQTKMQQTWQTYRVK
jgi:hypothetical protein